MGCMPARLGPGGALGSGVGIVPPIAGTESAPAEASPDSRNEPAGGAWLALAATGAPSRFGTGAAGAAGGAKGSRIKSAGGADDSAVP